MSPCILAIESSCDETAAAVIGKGNILSNIVASQPVHSQYGGVVPELASRAHIVNIVPVVDAALQKANITKNNLDAIAFTKGPGLLGSLLVGSSFAKAMSLALHIPLIAVHHMQAHVLAHFIEDPKPEFPFLCLTVSGGHTQIVLIKDYYDMEIVGETIDDAAGEAFDKTASLLKLPYPGGPMIDQLAGRGDKNAFEFPEPSVPGLDFSFSGLKTSILYFLKDRLNNDASFIENRLNDICASVQYRIVTILLKKLEKAAAQFGISRIAIAGGVSANSGLRNELHALAMQHGWMVFLPRFEYCTDNAAMVAMAAHYKFLAADFETLLTAPAAGQAW